MEMTRTQAIDLALSVLKPFKESSLYGSYRSAYDGDRKEELSFTDEEYETMLTMLEEEYAESWSILYEVERVVYRIGPFENDAEALMAAIKAQANGEFDVTSQRVYLLDTYHRMTELSMADCGPLLPEVPPHG